MCNAFNGLVTRTGRVEWNGAMDSHSDLVSHCKLKDDTADPDKMKFARFEIAPKNKNYLKPDKWVFKIDKNITPTWFKDRHERACWAAHKKWLAKLDKILVRKKMIHPFKDVKPPKKITAKHIKLLKEWVSVRDSVWFSVWDSVGYSVGYSVRASVWDSVWDSVGDSVRDSVWDSVWDSVRASVRDSVVAYVGTFFNIPKWEYVKHKKGVYPFKSLDKLWNMGLVPSFDGKKWRLHGGKDAKILFEISKEELEKE
jgi:hypothetical protein